MDPSDPQRLSPATSRDIESVYAAQEAHAEAVRETSAKQRKRKLERLCEALRASRTRFHQALRADFRKPPVETDLTELKLVLDEAAHAIDHLDTWMSPDRVGGPLLFTGTRSEIHYEPKGVALILSPWNYPLTLTLGPLVGALAAGNCVVLKPSEHTPHTNRILKSLLTDLYEEHEVALLSGDEEVAQALLQKPFDHVYFTGSTPVGRLVMQAAAQHPTSVTLELGGKSPVIVDGSADLDLAAERIAWAKFTNAGQTCIAPDYVLVDNQVQDALVDRLVSVLHDFYGTAPERWQDNPDYARLINKGHWTKIVRLLQDSVESGATVRAGGQYEEDSKYVSPTILTDVPRGAGVMQEEIFGPLLPILSVDRIEAAIEIVNDKPNPLSIYLFTNRERTVQTVLTQTSAGSTCINETLLHFGNPELPFGGVGHSGIGRGHGEAGFRTFSNERSVMRRSYGASVLNTLFPPYDGFTTGAVDTILQYLSGR